MKPNREFLVLRTWLGVLSMGAIACGSDPGHAGRSSADWIAQLDSGNAARKAEAAGALGKILQIRPDYPKVVTALVAALHDTTDVVRIAAASALTAEGVDTRAAIEGLHEVLHDSVHADVRTTAVLIVSSLGPKRAGALISYLCELLSDRNPRVRVAVLDALAAIGPEAYREIPTIAQMMPDSVAEVRQAVLRALATLHADTSVLVPAARSALSDSSAIVRAAAADALRSIGSMSARAVTDLTRALEDESGLVVSSAMMALSAIGPTARTALPALRRMRTSGTGNQEMIVQTIAILEGRTDRRTGSEPTGRERCRINPTASGC